MKSNKTWFVSLHGMIAAMLLVISLLVMPACGRSGSPVPPLGSVYPMKYPRPDDKTLKNESVSVSPKSGAYIDPSVRATELDSSTKILPGSNLPYSQQSGGSFMDQSSGVTTQSPLPTVIMPEPVENIDDNDQNIEKQ